MQVCRTISTQSSNHPHIHPTLSLWNHTYRASSYCMKLTIPSPCSENWNNMTPQGRNKFCASCRKTIIDFSTLSDAAVIRYLQEQPQDVCGRFSNTQLERDLVQDYRFPFKFSRIAAGMLGLLSLTGAIHAQHNPQRDESGKKIHLAPESKTAVNAQADGTVVIKGKITDRHTGEPLPFVMAGITGTSINTISDIDGEYTLSIPADRMKAGIILQFRTVGYQEKKEMLKVNGTNRIVYLDAALGEEASCIVGAVVIVEKQEGFFKKLFHRKKKRHADND